MTTDPTNYRDKLYQNYATLVMRTPDTFDVAMADRWGKAYDYYLRHWLPPRQDAVVLDVACGAGKLLHFFKRRGYSNLTGVDLSPEQVALARQVIPDIVQGDVLPFLAARPNHFDLITGLDIIEHLEKPVVLQFLEACFQALKPGGRLILETVNADTPFALPILYGDFTHESCFTPQTVLALLTMTGFSAIEVRETGPVPYGYSLKSSLRYLVWRALRMGIVLTNTVETGRTGSGIFTRVMISSALKP
jgi:2-polyprenyl-3-methyl-5-hydroxy-6-metoxy-1,4-benzoquinol methylase